MPRERHAKKNTQLQQMVRLMNKQHAGRDSIESVSENIGITAESETVGSANVCLRRCVCVFTRTLSDIRCQWCKDLTVTDSALVHYHTTFLSIAFSLTIPGVRKKSERSRAATQRGESQICHSGNRAPYIGLFDKAINRNRERRGV